MQKAQQINSQGAVRAMVFPIVITLSIAHLLNDTMQSVIPALYPLIKQDLGLTFSQIGIITLVFQLTSSILQPLVGRYTDKHPKPYALATGMAFSLVGLAILSTAHNFWTILLGVSILGWGSSIFHPNASRVTQIAAGKRKGLAQSIFQVGGSTGTAIGPLLAALIVIPYGQIAVSYFSIIALIGFVLLFRIGSWYKVQLQDLNSNAHQKSRAPAHGLSKNKVIWALTLLVILLFSKSLYSVSMTNYFTFFLIEKFDISVQQSQVCLFLFLASCSLGVLLGGAIGDRFGRKYVIWGSILGAAPFTIALPYVSFEMTIILSFIIGIVISSAFSAILVYAIDLMPGNIGTIAGIFFGLSFGLGGLGSAVLGYIADLTSIGFVFQTTTVFPLVGIVAAFLPNIEKSKAKSSN